MDVIDYWFTNPKVRAFDFYFGQALGSLLLAYKFDTSKGVPTPELQEEERKTIDAIVARAEYAAERTMASRAKYVATPEVQRGGEDVQEYLRRDR